MYDTIFLNPKTWDLEIDSNGDLAYAKGDYALAQDVASAARLWYGENPYDPVRGIRYDGEILGRTEVVYSIYKKMLAETCKAVPNVTDIDLNVTLNSSNRIVFGNIIASTSENTHNINMY